MYRGDGRVRQVHRFYGGRQLGCHRFRYGAYGAYTAASAAAGRMEQTYQGQCPGKRSDMHGPCRLDSGQQTEVRRCDSPTSGYGTDAVHFRDAGGADIARGDITFHRGAGSLGCGDIEDHREWAHPGGGDGESLLPETA